MSAELLDEFETDEETTIPKDHAALSTEDLTQELKNEGQPAQTYSDDDLPEKYRGKTPKEIAQMHQEAERLIGKQSSEVGELRQFVDGYIKGQLANKAPEAQEEEEDDSLDFFEDPKKAVSRAIENHPSVIEASQQAHRYKTQAALLELKERHPDLPQVIQDPNFVQWVKGSKIRTELFQRADQGYDVDAADELVSSYKERTRVVQQTKEAEQKSRSEQVKAASTGGAVGGATPQGSGARVYRRTDLIKLMQTDPDRYEALSDEIMRAYKEGRVR